MRDWRAFWGWTIPFVALIAAYLLIWGTDGKLSFSILSEGAGLVLLVAYALLTLIARKAQHKPVEKPE